MAARKQRMHPDLVRDRIQTTQLLNRLSAHALSERPLMDNSQVNAAKALINKVLPDLAAMTLSGDPDRPMAITFQWLPSPPNVVINQVAQRQTPMLSIVSNAGPSDGDD